MLFCLPLRGRRRSLCVPAQVMALGRLDAFYLILAVSSVGGSIFYKDFRDFFILRLSWSAGLANLAAAGLVALAVLVGLNSLQGLFFDKQSFIYFPALLQYVASYDERANPPTPTLPPIRTIEPVVTLGTHTPRGFGTTVSPVRQPQTYRPPQSEQDVSSQAQLKQEWIYRLSKNR